MTTAGPAAASMAMLIAMAGCSKSAAPPSAALASTPNPSVFVGPIPGPGSRAQADEIRNPLENDAAARQEGRQLFVRYNCSGCHGGHAGGGMGPSLRDVTWIYGDSPAHVFSSISEGRANGMPAWGSLLPQDQIWRIVTYVRTLNTPREAAPPSPAPKSASPGAVPPD